jgi:hypothetical protein
MHKRSAAAPKTDRSAPTAQGEVCPALSRFVARVYHATLALDGAFTTGRIAAHLHEPVGVVDAALSHLHERGILRAVAR